MAFDVDLDELCEVFPEWGDDRIKTAHAILTRFVMFRIGEDFDRFNHGHRGKQRITLFHDRTEGNGKYDPTILARGIQFSNERLELWLRVILYYHRSDGMGALHSLAAR